MQSFPLSAENAKENSERKIRKMGNERDSMNERDKTIRKMEIKRSKNLDERMRAHTAYIFPHETVRNENEH